MTYNCEAQRAQNLAIKNSHQVISQLNGNNGEVTNSDDMAVVPQRVQCNICNNDLLERPQNSRIHPYHRFALNCDAEHDSYICSGCVANIYLNDCSRLANPRELNRIYCPQCRQPTPINRPGLLIRLYGSGLLNNVLINNLRAYLAALQIDRQRPQVRRQMNLDTSERCVIITQEYINDIHVNHQRLVDFYSPCVQLIMPNVINYFVRPVNNNQVDNNNAPVAVPPNVNNNNLPPPQIVNLPPLVPANPPAPEQDPLVPHNGPNPAPIPANPPQPPPINPHINLPLPAGVIVPLPPVDNHEQFLRTRVTTIYTIQNVCQRAPWTMPIHKHFIVLLCMILLVYRPSFVLPLLLCLLDWTKERFLFVCKLVLLLFVFILFSIPSLHQTDDEPSFEEVRHRFLHIIRQSMRVYYFICLHKSYSISVFTTIIATYILPLLRVSGSENRGMINLNETDVIGYPMWLPTIELVTVNFLPFRLPTIAYYHYPPSVVGGKEYTGHMQVSIYNAIHDQLIGSRYANVATSELLRYISGDVANLLSERNLNMDRFDRIVLIHTQCAIYQSVLTVRTSEREFVLNPGVLSGRDLQW
jgi:hypothetical protein